MVKPNILNRLNTKAIHFIRHKKNLIYPDAIILMYHRVADFDSDPWSSTVTPKHFAEHLEIIREHGNPLSLQQLRNRLRKNESVKKSIVVTFDDGYADNLYNAKPLLEKYDIPATVFVTSGAINKQREFWWDELGRLIFQPLNLPRHLQLNVCGESFLWVLSDKEYFSQDNTLCHSLSSITRNQKVNTSTHNRISLYHEINHILKYLPSFKRDKVLGELRVWTNSDFESKNNNPSLTSNDLVTLEAGGLIKIGAHTVSHPFLSELPVNSQRDEIQNSKYFLENILDHPVDSFSYPYGSYTNDTVSLVEQAGFKCACSIVKRRVKGNSNKFLLPRVRIKNWDGDKFVLKISKII